MAGSEMLGNLTLDALKHDLVQTVGVMIILISGIAVITLLSYFHRWKWLWKEWLTSLDPKKIGVMYIIVAAIMLFKGVSDAVLMRIQQVVSVADSASFFS